jgi:2-oxo-3-hexenedioate decarboxylase
MPISPDKELIARKVLGALDECRQIDCLTSGDPGFDNLAAYKVAALVGAMRKSRGEKVVGRKIGFTNRTIWDEYGVHAPIWGNVYDRTLHRLDDLDGPFDLARLIEPRIEPEIVFSLARAPQAGMSEAELLGCIGWVAHGFEIVQSLYAGWRFKAPDTIAAFGLHGALVVGEPVAVEPRDHAMWRDALAPFDITLSRNGEAQDRGNAANVLGGGPLTALSHLVELLPFDPEALPLAPGEIISTGTLTRALPIAPGETWSTVLEGVPIPGISLSFR